MTSQASLSVAPTVSRLSGRWAIASGVFGILAFGCLAAFLASRPSEGTSRTADLLLKGHDVVTLLQSFCLMPLALALDAIYRRDWPESHRANRSIGTVAVLFLGMLAGFVLLSMAKLVADVLYMIPQGAVGGWLIFVCRQSSIGLPRGLRWLGIVAGTGLLLVGIFPVAYGLLVDPAIFHGPVSDDDPLPPGTDEANIVVHAVLALGTLTGCTAYPLWAIFVGRWLLGRANR